MSQTRKILNLCIDTLKESFNGKRNDWRVYGSLLNSDEFLHVEDTGEGGVSRFFKVLATLKLIGTVLLALIWGNYYAWQSFIVMGEPDGWNWFITVEGREHFAGAMAFVGMVSLIGTPTLLDMTNWYKE